MDGDTVGPRRMSLHLLKKITNGFSEDRKVGSGSYGNVYKGVDENGETIAVKLLHYIPQLGDKQFVEEYVNVVSLQHKHVVRLVGYCNETQRELQQINGKWELVDINKRALCFEYMHNGSLTNFISDEFTGHDWRTRYAIIKGICLGLKYLHEEMQDRMYHLDIKPANVLMDKNMIPKLADFGMSRLFGGDKTQMTKSAIGTHGYVPPEYLDSGIISDKFDIFSLGVVIIKIMTGPTSYYRSAEMSPQKFIDLVHANWMKRPHTDSYSDQVKRCIEIALSCVDNDRHKRPIIGLIVSKLNETETVYKICPCISTESELMDMPLDKLISYPLHVTDNRGKLHEITISTTCKTQDGTATFEEPIQPKIKIIHCTNRRPAFTVDVHPVEPWILVGHLAGSASVWNLQTQARLMEFHMGRTFVCAVRFIPQKQWVIAGDFNGHIHVYSYTTKEKLKEFQAHASRVTSLAVHPTDPFVLSSSQDNLIKLWNWENDWECIRTFRAHTGVVQSVKFSPLTASNTFASASCNGTVKIWSIFSDAPITTLECGTAVLTSVDYFIVPGSHQHIVAGDSDRTAHIWDMETKTCIQHVEGLQCRSGVAVVDCLSGHPILVTVSRDQKFSFCNSSTHRYQSMVDFNLGEITDYAYIMGTRSLVVACICGIAIMEIS